jgi:hypothetical protein
MTNDLKDLEDIILLCTKHGVRSLKLPELELQLGSDGPTLSTPPMKELKFPDPDMAMPTDDDMLNWSTPLTTLEEPKQANGEI